MKEDLKIDIILVSVLIAILAAILLLASCNPPTSTARAQPNEPNEPDERSFFVEFNCSQQDTVEFPILDPGLTEVTLCFDNNGDIRCWRRKVEYRQGTQTAVITCVPSLLSLEVHE